MRFLIAKILGLIQYLVLFFFASGFGRQLYSGKKDEGKLFKIFDKATIIFMQGDFILLTQCIVVFYFVSMLSSR